MTKSFRSAQAGLYKPTARTTTPVQRSIQFYGEAARTVSEQLHPDLPPLSMWRTHPLDDLTSLDLDALQSSIASVALAGEPHWPEARSGNVAAAVGILLRLLKSGRTTGTALNLAGTVLLIAAIGGNVTAALVLAHARRAVMAGAADPDFSASSPPDPINTIAALQARLTAAVEG